MFYVFLGYEKTSVSIFSKVQSGSIAILYKTRLGSCHGKKMATRFIWVSFMGNQAGFVSDFSSTAYIAALLCALYLSILANFYRL